MGSMPQFIKEGWKPHGPGKCRCPRCGGIASTNAMARARHVCPPKPEAPRAPLVCERCSGTGWLDPIGPKSDGSYITSRPCPRCAR